MKFSSGASFSVAPYENSTLVGLQTVVRNPMYLPHLFPTTSQAFQMIFADKMCLSATVQLDVQFENKIHTAHVLEVSIVKFDTIHYNNVTVKNVGAPTVVCEPCKFTFGDDLKTFEDEEVNYRNVWSLKRELSGLQNVCLRGGDSLALCIQHSNMSIRSLCVSGALKFK